MKQDNYEMLCVGAFAGQLLANVGVGFYAGFASAQGQDSNLALQVGTVAATSLGQGAVTHYGVKNGLEDKVNQFDLLLKFLSLSYQGADNSTDATRLAFRATGREVIFGAAEMGLGYGAGYLIGKLIS